MRLTEIERVGEYAARVRVAAKLNLSLRVVGRRTSDGYHLLQMVNIALPGVVDTVELRLLESDVRRVSVTPVPELAPFFSPDLIAELSDPTQNIAARAVERTLAARVAHDRSLRGSSDVAVPGGYEIRITKGIPAGGGLGGGSADAAAAIRLTEFLLGAPMLSADHRVGLATSLGADVPYFLTGGSCAITGIGEQVTPIEIAALRELCVILVMPPFGVSTANVYGLLRTVSEDELHTRNTLAVPTRSIIGDMVVENDLEELACRLEPRLSALLAALRRVVSNSGSGSAVGMTGSGSTCFVLVHRGSAERLYRDVSAALGPFGASIRLIQLARAR